MTTVRSLTADVPEIREPGFIGREREIAALAKALVPPAAVVLIEGEAGIGKSRLIREFLALPAVRKRHALLTACPPLSQPHTLGPMTDALRQAIPAVTGLGLSGLAGALRALFPEWAEDLPPTPEPAEDASAARYRVFAALGELLARTGMHVLIVEDAQWADVATLEFLLFLAARESSAVTLVVTYRGHEIPDGSLLPRLSRQASSAGGMHLVLCPLDPAETSGMVSSMLENEPVSAEFAAFVHEHTDGIPLAVEESVRVMVERCALARESGAWVHRDLGEIIVPRSIRDSVLDRSARLGSDAQVVLRAAAVLSDPAREAQLTAVAALPAGRFRAGLDESLDSGLLSEGDHGLVSFRHALVCRAVYEAMPTLQRRTMHLRAGEALEGTSPAQEAQLTRHFREAGDFTRWCAHAETTADVALATGDETTAAAVLHELITSGAPPARSVARITRKIRFVSFFGVSRYQELAAALRSLLDARTGNLAPAEEAAVRVQLGRILTVAEEHEEACGELERAIPYLAHDPAEAIQAMMLLAYSRGTSRPASVHLCWIRRAAKLAAQAPITQTERLRLAVDRVTALLMLGEEEGWSEAGQLPADTETPRERYEVTRGWLNTGELAMMWGRYQDAARLLGSCLEAAERHQYLLVRDQVLANQAQLAWFTGAWEGLAERLSSLADNDDTQPGVRLQAALVTGWLHALAGRPVSAEERFRFVLAEWRGRGEVAYIAQPAAGLARLRLADGRVGEALTATDESVEIIARKGIWVWATDVAAARVQALLAVGRVDEAARLICAFALGLRGRNAPAPKAALLQCRALLAEARGDHARAAVLFGRVAAAWQAMPRPYDSLLAREQQADCLIGCGEPGAGLALLRQAVRDFAALGARGDALRVIGTLRQHGVQVARPWWGGRRSYGGQLSPREFDVVRLLAVGRSNRDIGQALFISPKTVACHVDSARRKLGMASRTALVAWAAAAAGTRESEFYIGLGAEATHSHK